MLSAPLQELVDVHAPLSTLQRAQGGGVTLLTPGVNVLALNATFLPDDPNTLDLDAVRHWHEGQGLPVLVASAGPPGAPPLPGAREVARLRVGTWAPDPGSSPSDVVVEQTSRLNLDVWARVLAAAHGTPGWAGALARQLAARLEGDRESVLLLAYREGREVGALLWRDGERGGGAHLWGSLDVEATPPLLSAAFDLGGGLRLSCPADSPLALGDARPTAYWLLEAGALGSRRTASG